MISDSKGMKYNPLREPVKQRCHPWGDTLLPVWKEETISIGCQKERLFYLESLDVIVCVLYQTGIE